MPNQSGAAQTWWRRGRIRSGGFTGGDFTVAPVSVLVDPIRALRVFGLEKGGSFSEKVLYIYNKQLEEADLVVISKCDLLDEARLASLRAGIAARFPGKEIVAVSPRDGITGRVV